MALGRLGEYGVRCRSKKEPQKTCIRTSRESIEGLIYKLPQSRLLDMMNNKTEPFFAVCDATVCSANDGKLLYKTSFLAVNKKHVIHISGECPVGTRTSR